MRTSFRTYLADPGAIVFEQQFPDQLSIPTSTSAQTVFPSFNRAGGAKDFDCFAYHGVFPALKPCSLSNYQESHQGFVVNDQLSVVSFISLKNILFVVLFRWLSLDSL